MHIGWMYVVTSFKEKMKQELSKEKIVFSVNGARWVNWISTFKKKDVKHLQHSITVSGL